MNELVSEFQQNKRMKNKATIESRKSTSQYLQELIDFAHIYVALVIVRQMAKNHIHHQQLKTAVTRAKLTHHKYIVTTTQRLVVKGCDWSYFL